MGNLSGGVIFTSFLLFLMLTQFLKSLLINDHLHECEYLM